MRSLTYKNLIWKTTWYKKHGTNGKPDAETAAPSPAVESPRGPAAGPEPRRLERMQADHWVRGVKHGWNKV